MGILDLFEGDGWQSLLGISPGNAAPGAPPPMPPQQVMQQAPPAFSPNSTLGTGMIAPPPAEPLSFADRAQPVQAAIAGGEMDPQGRNFTPFAPSATPTPSPAPPAPVGPMAAEPPPAMTGGPRSIGLPPVNAGGSPAGGPPMPPMPVGAGPPTMSSGGGLMAALGLTSPESRRNVMASLGHGLQAVGGIRPGTSKGAAFGAGAGGAITGGISDQDKQIAQKRQAQNDLFTQSSTAFKDMLAADAAGDTSTYKAAQGAYLKARAAALMTGGGGKGSNAWQATPEGRVVTAEQRVAAFEGPRRKSIDAQVRSGVITQDDGKKAYEQLDKETEAYRQRIYQSLKLDKKEVENVKTLGTQSNPYDAKSMSEEDFNLQVPMGGYFKDQSGKLHQRTKPPPGAENQFKPDQYGTALDDQEALTPAA